MQSEAEALVQAKRRHTDAEQSEVAALHARLHALEAAAGELLPLAEAAVPPEASRSSHGQALPQAIAAVRSALSAARQPSDSTKQCAARERMPSELKDDT